MSEVTKDAKGVSREPNLLRHFDKWMDCPGNDMDCVDGKLTRCPKCQAIRALIAKDNEPGGTELGKTNAQGAAALSERAVPQEALPVGKNPTSGNPGPTMTDDEAFEELVGSRFQLEAFLGSADKGGRAAIAHLRSRLATKKVSREWVDEFSQKVTWGPFAGWAIQMLEELGVEVEDK